MSKSPGRDASGGAAPPSEWRHRHRLNAFAAGVAGLCAAITALPQTSAAGAIDEIRKRGVVTCGVSEGVPGFSAIAEGGGWSGLDVDFCRALAAAVLGDATKTRFVPTSSEDRFRQLASGAVDVLTRNTSWTLRREIEEGAVFPGVLYFDGQGFMVPKELGLSSPDQLSGARICVLSGTTSEGNARAYFARAGIEVDLVSFAHREKAIAAYEAGTCDVRTADRSALFGERLLLADPNRHMVLPGVISKEALGPVVRAGDGAWASSVHWVLMGLIAAEELHVTQKQMAAGALSSDQQRFVEESGKLGARLGLADTWVVNVIRHVGNYGEMFDRNLGKDSPFGMTRGINALWTDGGLMYAPPMP